jgi:Holliday junction resolvasome RuvABC endonuclease subunit
MIIMVIDPAESTGYCLAEISEDGSTADIYQYDFIDVDKSSDYEGDHCIDLMSQIECIVNENAVENAGVEAYFFSKKFANGSCTNASYRAATHIVLRQNDVPYTILNITAWKNFIAGRSTPTADQKKKWGKDPAKKLCIQQALYDTFGFRFPNHSLSKKTGKPILFRYDIVDAVAMMVYFLKAFLRVRDVTMSVEVPEDVEFKTESKKMFVYPAL